MKAIKTKGKNDGDFAGKLQWIKSQFKMWHHFSVSHSIGGPPKGEPQDSFNASIAL